MRLTMQTRFRVLLLAVLLAGIDAPADVTGQNVKDAIARGAAHLKAGQREDGSWGYNWQINRASHAYDPGLTALVTLALRLAGLPPDDPAIAHAVKYLLAAPDDNTYSAALKIMALAEVDREKYAAEIVRAVEFLVRTQLPNGQWTYGEAEGILAQMQVARAIWPDYGAGDNSNTQFALLALHVARQCGVPVPERIWKASDDHFTKTQQKDGGWGYSGTYRGESYGSMTAAGVASLFIAGNYVFHPVHCGEFEEDKRLAAGLAWIDKYFSVEQNPYVMNGTVVPAQVPVGPWYYLYCLERVGILSGNKYIGKRDWYRLGAVRAVETQQKDGSWGDEAETAFAILFLAKGHTPLLLNKLHWDGDWSDDLDDAKALMEMTGQELGRVFAWQTVRADASADELLEAPVLYLNGHHAPSLTDAQCERLREFTEEGGLIVAEACCGSEEFDQGIRALAERLFHGRKLEPLGPEHPVYRTRFQFDRREEHFLEGVTWACRTTMIYSPRDLSCSWDPHCPDRKTGAELARRIGINLMLFAMGDIPLRDRLDPVHPGENQQAGPARGKEGVVRGALVLAQLRHDGDWNPDPAACPRLMEYLRTRANLTVVPQKRGIRPTDPNLANFPLLYMTGHESFQFTPAEREAIVAHLNRGGFLFAEACCGREEFDRSFREQVALMFPEQRLEEIPLTHAVFHSGFEVATVSTTPALAKAKPDLRAPILEGIYVNGALVLVYSRYAILCPVEDHPCPQCLGYAKDDAFRIAADIVLYAMSR